MLRTKQIIITPVGTIEASWSEVGLFACELQPPELAKTKLDREPSMGDCGLRLSQAFQRYFETGWMDWDLNELDWAGVTGFQRHVLEACFAIPSGETKTYAQLAAAAGRPNAARAVGGVMARNRWPILIPCHRVVGSNGKLTGYSGQGGIKTKRQLLDLESAKHEFQPAEVLA